jgi:hypothetical protein
MDTSELTRALRAATDDLEPPTGFAEAVLRGGRRRRTRLRLGIATGTAVAVAVVAAGGLALAHDPTATLTGNPLVDAPTSGNLAGDTQFRTDAIAAWEAGKKVSPNADRGIFDDVRTEPSVYWAGDTPSGRAAVVVQEAQLHPHDDLGSEDADQTRTLVGLVATDPADGRFKLVNDQYDADAGRFLFGDGDRTVLILDRGVPLFVSHDASVENGQIRANWQRLALDGGVAVEQLPRGTSPTQVVAVAADHPPANYADAKGRLDLEPSSWYLDQEATQSPDSTGLDWHGMSWTVGSDGGPQVDAAAVFFDEVSLPLSNGSAVGNYTSTWYIRAGLADGRVAVLGNNQTGGSPSRLYAVLVDAGGARSVVPGDEVDAKAVLPVRFRLPDEQGWVVAAKDQPLSYRLNDAWIGAGTGAALIPDMATQVLVGDKVVDLPR